MTVRHFEAATVDDLMRAAVEAVIADGTHVSPSKGSCRELVAAAFTLTNPRARVSRSASRGRIFSALGELCWYLSGSCRTDDIAYYVSMYRRFDEDGIVYGAYGPRLVCFDGTNQIQYAIRTLRAAPSSRQVVLQLFDHQDVTAPHLDVPCTCTLQYLLRDGELTAITYMRSNDVFRGLPHDLFCFTMLHELIAASVGAELGAYHHMVGSLHIYDQDAGALGRYLSEGWQPTTRAMPPLPPGDPWPAVHGLLQAERMLRTGTPACEVDLGPDPYWADLGRLLCAYAARKGPPSTLEAIRKSMHSDYYDCYLADRVDTLERALPLQ